MKTLLRAAAIAVASTALVAGSTSGAIAAPGDGVAANVAIQPAATSGIASIATTYVPVAIASATPGVTVSSLKATVLVNGVPVAYGVSIYPSSGLAYQRSWGAGVVSITSVIGAGTDARDGTSRYFYDKPIAAAVSGSQIRFGLESRYDNIRVTKRGKKITFKLKARYINAAGRPASVGRATIQVHKSGKWRTVKNVKLKKSGTATYKRSDKKKRKYRLVIKTTNTIQGGNTKGIRI